MSLIHVGFGNMAAGERVIAVLQPNSSPARRLKEAASEAGLLIDATQGRKTRSLLVMDSRHVVLSAIQPETITARFAQEEEDADVS